jgi:hypothetical protein
MAPRADLEIAARSKVVVDRRRAQMVRPWSLEIGLIEELEFSAGV